MKKKVVLIILLFSVINSIFAKESGEDIYVHFAKVELTEQELNTMDFNTVYLVAASPTSESVGSLGAHAFVVLAKDDDFDSAVAINFYAYHERLTILEKIGRGATVGLEGYIDIRPFSYINERYTIGQNRTLFIYKTNIEKQYIPQLIRKFYEYKNTDLKYQFFNYNCSSLLGEVFSSVLTTDEKKYNFPTLIMPGRLISLFEDRGLLVEEKVISPALIKIKYDNISLDIEDIKSRAKFFEIHGSETTLSDGFELMDTTVDNFDSHTIFSERVSSLYLGYDKLKLAFGTTLFNNELYEQRQSALVLYEIKLFDLSFTADSSSINLDKFTILESGRYTKINLSSFTPSSYYLLKINEENQLLDFNVGYGISVGNQNTLFSIIPSVETNIANLLLTLKIKSILTIYSENSFVLLKIDYPIYNQTSISNKEIQLKAGLKFTDSFSLESSYDFIDEDFNLYLKYNFYPLLF